MVSGFRRLWTHGLISSISLPYRWTRSRVRQFDVDEYCGHLSDIAGCSMARARDVYDQCVNGEMAKVYASAYDQSLLPFDPFQIRRHWVGFEVNAGLDRITGYCLTRLLKPDVFIETGIMWGEMSLFVLQAMKENGHGELHSFDIGWEQVNTDYGTPIGEHDIGFLVPNELRGSWEMHIGDSLELLPGVLEEVSPVDVFYHDSLHTYDHMLGEYKAVYPHMVDGGVLMSEDIHQNDAWDDFLQSHETQGDVRFWSHLGIEPGREIGATVVNSS